MADYPGRIPETNLPDTIGGVRRYGPGPSLPKGSGTRRYKATVTAEIKLLNSDEVSQAIKTVFGDGNKDVLTKRLQAAVKEAFVKAVLPNIRRRFLIALPSAFAVRVAKKKDNYAPQLEPLESKINKLAGFSAGRAKLTRLVERLSDAMERYDQLVMGDADREALSDQYYEIQQARREYEKEVLTYKTRYSARSLEKQGIEGSEQGKQSSLGKRAFGASILRLKTQTVLNALMALRVGTVMGNDIYLGDMTRLDAIQTPSATQGLTGKPTSSKLTVLWRHLEFGTGTMRKRTGNVPITGGMRGYSPREVRGLYDGPAGAWFYGPTGNVGFLVEGTYPMNFLLTGQGQPYKEDWDRFEAVLMNALQFGPQGSNSSVGFETSDDLPW